MRISLRGIAVSMLLASWGCSAERSRLDLTAPGGQQLPPVRNAPPGLLLSLAPPVVLQTHTTEWSEYATGAQPAGWSQQWDPTSFFQVAAEPTVASGKVLQWSGSQPRNRWVLTYDAFGSPGDQEVFTDFRVRTLGSGPNVYYLGVAAVRVSGTALDERGYAIFFVHDPVSGQRTLALATWINGGYFEFASIPFTWQIDSWYSVRLQAYGSSIRARVWPRGTTEPSAWTLEAADQNYSSGRMGVFHHDDGTVQWARWTGSILQDTSTAAPPTGATSQTTFATDAVGSQPAGWTETSFPASSSWSVVADATAADGRVLRNVTTATDRHILRYDAVPDATTAQEVLVRMRLRDDDDRGPGIALRHTMDAAGRETAYVAYLRSITDEVEINVFVAGGWQFIDAASFVNDPGQWYWMRFRADGAELLLRVWADGAPEPSTWTYRGSNAAIAAGSVGLYTYEANTVDYDDFSVATGGLTAPTPRGTPPAPTISQLNVSPSAQSLTVGATAQFQATASMSDGSTTSPVVTWSATGGTISSSGLFTAGSSPGTYQVTATEPGSGLSGAATVNVTPREAIVTVQNASRLFGQPNPSFVGTTQGLLAGDALSCSYSTSATPSSPAGTYAITAACTPTPTYRITVVPGTLTVGPATPTIVWNPADVTNPKPLGAAQLNAVAVGVDGQPLSGTAAYSTNGTTVSSGTVLRPGLNTPLTVTFTPNGPNAANYTMATKTVSTFNVLNAIDITPNVSANYLYLSSGATEISVAILGTASFDARTVVVSTLTPTLGNGTDPGARLNVYASGAPKTVLIDINGDGRTDLVCYYRKSDVVNAARVTTSTTQLALLGETTDGRKIKGVDQVIVMP